MLVHVLHLNPSHPPTDTHPHPPTHLQRLDVVCGRRRRVPVASQDVLLAGALQRGLALLELLERELGLGGHGLHVHVLPPLVRGHRKHVEVGEAAHLLCVGWVGGWVRQAGWRAHTGVCTGWACAHPW